MNAADLQADYHNYALSPSSPYEGKGTDGQDPGFLAANYDSSRGAPTSDSITPSSGTGLVQTFRATYSDAAGWTDLSYTEFLINGALTGANACWVFYFPATNTLYLYTDTAGSVLGPIAAGMAGTLQNSQCALDTGASSASGSLNSITLNLALTFKSSFAGVKNSYLAAFSLGGLNSVSFRQACVRSPGSPAICWRFDASSSSHAVFRARF